MSDGSYRRIFTGATATTYMDTGISAGDIVYYGNDGSHSAVISGSPSPSSNPLIYANCISK